MQGYSSDATKVKQEQLASIASTIVYGGRKALDKRLIYEKDKFDDRIWFFDLNAGKGVDVEGNDGSPMIFFKTMQRTPKKQHKFGFICIENNKNEAGAFENLFNIVSRLPNIKQAQLQNTFNLKCEHYTFLYFDKILIILIKSDNKNAIDQIINNAKKKFYGLCYHDPNGHIDSDMMRSISLAPCFERTDLLINVSERLYAMCRGANKNIGCTYPYSINLDNTLTMIEKGKWQVRIRQLGNYKWRLALGTYWENLRIFPGFTKYIPYETNLKELEANQIAKDVKYKTNNKKIKQIINSNRFDIDLSNARQLNLFG